MEGEAEEGLEAEEGREGGTEGGGSPGGSSNVRFARGSAGESPAAGVEGVRFDARSSSICSGGSCCVGCCCGTIAVGLGDGCGCDVVDGGSSACGKGLS